MLLVTVRTPETSCSVLTPAISEHEPPEGQRQRATQPMCPGSGPAPGDTALQWASVTQRTTFSWVPRAAALIRRVFELGLVTPPYCCSTQLVQTLGVEGERVGRQSQLSLSQQGPSFSGRRQRREVLELWGLRGDTSC